MFLFVFCQCSPAKIELFLLPVSLRTACFSFACVVQCVRVTLRLQMYACDVCCRASASVCVLVLVLVLWAVCWLVCLLAIAVDVTECCPAQPFVRTACPGARMGMCMCVWACFSFGCLFVVLHWYQTRVYSTVLYCKVLYCTVEQTSCISCVSKFRSFYLLVFVGPGSQKARVVVYPSGVQ